MVGSKVAIEDSTLFSSFGAKDSGLHLVPSSHPFTKESQCIFAMQPPHRYTEKK